MILNQAQTASLGLNGAEKCDTEPAGGTFNSQVVPTIASETFRYNSTVS
jgi:hypothetical protein